MPEYTDISQYLSFDQDKVYINYELTVGSTVGLLLWSLTSSSSTTDNGFKVEVKTAKYDREYLPVTGSPVTVGMTTLPWFEIFFTEPCDDSYAATT